MPRVSMVRSGQTGYIGRRELYTVAPGRGPCIMSSSVYTTMEEAGPGALPVYNNPNGEFEVTLYEGAKASYNPAVSIAGDSFFRVELILPDGRKIRFGDTIPKEFWTR